MVTYEKRGRQCNQIVQTDTALKCHVKVYYDMYMVAYIYEELRPKNTSNDVMYYM